MVTFLFILLSRESKNCQEPNNNVDQIEFLNAASHRLKKTKDIDTFLFVVCRMWSDHLYCKMVKIVIRPLKSKKHSSFLYYLIRKFLFERWKIYQFDFDIFEIYSLSFMIRNIQLKQYLFKCHNLDCNRYLYTFNWNVIVLSFSL